MNITVSNLYILKKKLNDKMLILLNEEVNKKRSKERFNLKIKEM